MDYDKLLVNEDQYLAFRKLKGKNGSIVYFNGLAGSMNGVKATALYNLCKEENIGFVTFDYLGKGHSSGELKDCTFTDWRKNCYSVMEQLTSGQQLLIGSSVGAWLMFHTALKYPDKVSAMIGISSALDYSEVVNERLTAQQRYELDEYGVTKYNGHKITRKMLEDGENNLLLNKESLRISCPVRLLHSYDDDVVPYETTLTLSEKLITKDVKICLLKTGSHRMTDAPSLTLLFNNILSFLGEPAWNRRVLIKCLELLKRSAVK